MCRVSTFGHFCNVIKPISSQSFRQLILFWGEAGSQSDFSPIFPSGIDILDTKSPLLSIAVPCSVCFSAGDNPITEKVYLRTSLRLNKFPFPIDCKTCLGCIKYDQNVDKLFCITRQGGKIPVSLLHWALLHWHVKELQINPNLILWEKTIWLVKSDK